MPSRDGRQYGGTLRGERRHFIVGLRLQLKELDTPAASSSAAPGSARRRGSGSRNGKVLIGMMSGSRPSIALSSQSSAASQSPRPMWPSANVRRRHVAGCGHVLEPIQQAPGVVAPPGPPVGVGQEAERERRAAGQLVRSLQRDRVAPRADLAQPDAERPVTEEVVGVERDHVPALLDHAIGPRGPGRPSRPATSGRGATAGRSEARPSISAIASSTRPWGSRPLIA